MSATIFSTRLQSLRKEKGITQEQLASQLGVSAQAVSKWEKNGSYPDGDLLPRIADIFGVSMDYLYGRAERDCSMEKQLETAFRTFMRDKEWYDPAVIEKMQDCLWILHRGVLGGHSVIPERPRMEKEDGKWSASYLSMPGGFSFSRMNLDLEYNMVVKTPEAGFAAALESPEKLAELFAFLGKVENLRLIYFLLSLKGGEWIKEETLAKRLGMSVQQVQKAMDYMGGLAAGQGVVAKQEIVDEQDRSEVIYGNRSCAQDLLLMLLILATTLKQGNASFIMNYQTNIEGRVDRKQLEFLHE